MSLLRSLETDPRLQTRALWGMALAFAGLAIPQVVTLMRFQPLGFDFLPLWTAGRMAALGHADRVYDFVAVTRAQDWLVPHLKWVRPYAYPPTDLLILAPLGLAPFWAALAAWVGLSLGLFLYAGVRLGPSRPGLALVLMALSPAVLLAVLVGQTVLLAAGLAVLGVAELDRRPRWAGVLLGLAAALKPQVLLLAPVALLAGGALETAVAAALTGLAAVALSAALFGPRLWIDWLGSLAPFQRVVEETPHLTWGVITPYAAAHELGLPPLASGLLQAVCALFAVALVWRAWRRGAPAALRAAALLGGCLLVTPYAMHYDGSVVVPTAVCGVLAMATPGWTWRFVALFAATEIATPFVGGACLIAFLLLSFIDPRPALATAAAAA